MGRWESLAGALLSAAAGASLLGCYDSNCLDRLACPYLEEDVSCPADPAEAAGSEVPGKCGVWVSASHGHDTGDGSPEMPVATLGQALAKALRSSDSEALLP